MRYRIAGLCANLVRINENLYSPEMVETAENKNLTNFN